MMIVRNPEDRMESDQHFTRVDLVEAKNLITKKLGAQKAEKYFNLLNRFFSEKLNKSDFNKLCIVAVGRENIRLHNWLIGSILKNACLSTTTPPVKERSKHEFSSVNGNVANGYKITCLQSLYRDVLPKSPRKGRTPAFRDRKYRDRPSPLGKPQTVPPKVLEQQSATELNHSLSSRPIEVVSVEYREEVYQTAAESPGVYSRKALTAPFGVDIRANGTRKVQSALPLETCYSNGELPDTSSLRMRLEQKLEDEGVEVSLDYANLLNISLDMHLKRLIQPCLELASSVVGNRQYEEVGFQTLPGIQPVRYVQRPSVNTCASSVDLRAAMELDATLCWENRAIQLERVALQQDWQVGNIR